MWVLIGGFWNYAFSIILLYVSNAGVNDLSLSRGSRASAKLVPHQGRPKPQLWKVRYGSLKLFILPCFKSHTFRCRWSKIYKTVRNVKTKIGSVWLLELEPLPYWGNASKLQSVFCQCWYLGQVIFQGCALNSNTMFQILLLAGWRWTLGVQEGRPHSLGWNS